MPTLSNCRTRCTAVSALLAVAALNACTTRMTIEPPAQTLEVGHQGAVVIAKLDGSRIVLENVRVQGDSLHGMQLIQAVSASRTLTSWREARALPIAEVRSMTTSRFDARKTTKVFGGIFITLVGLVALAMQDACFCGS